MDDCVQEKLKHCVEVKWAYLNFFCGNQEFCGLRTPEADYHKALMQAMHNVEKNFFVVGVLEQFEDTLLLFERMLPHIYTGALPAYHSKRKNVKTSHK